jgi:tetratricopeptide (TPR) repeat protein
MGRHFQVYIDLLGPASQVPSRSYADEYYIVVPPAQNPQVDEIRHAYLHYLLDPLSVKFSEQLMKKRGLIDYAQRSPLLDNSYKSDFLLLATESLIKAVESRLARGAAGQQAVDSALAEGYILTPFFADYLPLYEKQQASMRLFLPDMIAAIDLKKEGKRLEAVQFASARQPGKTVVAASTADLTAPEKQLEKAEDLLYNQRDLEAAKAAYMKLLEQSDDKSLHARAYYGLGRTAALQKNPELAEKLFIKTLELSPDAQTHAWTEVYLGRLADLAGERDQAAKHYQAALAIQGGSDAARKAAEQGLKTTFQPRN